MSLRLLHLNACGLTAHAWKGGRLHREDGFATDDIAGFVRYLSIHSNKRFRLLLDIAEESLVTERIPRLRGVDRQNLIARRLAKRFPGSELSLTVPLGRSGDSEDILCAAISPPESVRPWLAALTGSEARIAGIHGCALLAGALRERLGETGSAGLLCTVEAGWVRQNWLVDGLPRFTRSMPLPSAEPAGIARSLVEESGRLQLFLVSQRLIRSDDPLEIDWLAPPALAGAIESAFREKERPSIRIRVTDTFTAATRLRLPDPPQSTQCSDLLLALLARRPPRLQYAPATLRAVDRLHRLKRLAYGIGLTAVAGGMLAAGWATQQAAAMRRDADSLTSAAATFAAERRTVLAGLTVLEMPADTLRARLAERDTLLGRQHTPDETWPAIARVLDHHPEITIDALEWKNADDAGSTADSTQLLGRHRSSGTTPAPFRHFVDELALERTLNVRTIRSPDPADGGRFVLDIKRPASR